MRSNPERDLMLEARAAASLLDDLRRQMELDEEDAATVVEGETNLIEAITEALNISDDAAGMCQAIDARIQALKARRERYAHKVERIRGLIADAMLMAGQKTLPLPGATLTVSDAPPSVVIINEDEVPDGYWTTKTTRSLNKKAIGDAIKAGSDVPGATLENMKPRLTVRVK